ncbi:MULTISPECIES: helix-turn-helix domain-containing protein [unclassified Microcoleus]|uniref:helix-turn-helix domain-containing protein n=1 Tax=unclassified Microcoleus TaxID=2642155 RepID=UPI002FD51ABE
MSIDKNQQDDGQDSDQLLMKETFQETFNNFFQKPIPPASKNSQKDLPPLPVVHSDLDEYGLDPYEFRLYAHVVRRTGGKPEGECFAKLKKTAEICHMSVRKAQYALKTLCDAGLILKEQRRGRTDVYRLTPKSNWKPKEELKQIRQKAKESKESKVEDSEEE